MSIILLYITIVYRRKKKNDYSNYEIRLVKPGQRLVNRVKRVAGLRFLGWEKKISTHP
jgi:hypothetical protein